MPKRYVYFLAILALVLVFFVWKRSAQNQDVPGERYTGPITSFEDCVAAGNAVMESYPEQCRTEDGQVFAKDIGNEMEMKDMIVVEMPRPGDVVSNPIEIKGRARGVWFFEASFPAKVLDETGNILGQTPIQADGEWMTEDFVEFSGKIPFAETDLEKGTLVLEKDNPSGLPENDAQLRIPVRFK